MKPGKASARLSVFRSRAGASVLCGKLTPPGPVDRREATNTTTVFPWPLLAVICFVLCGHSGFAQKQPQDRPVPYPTAQGATEGRKLVDEILSQRPSEAPTNGVLKIRDAEGHERSVPVQMAISETQTNWTHTYETVPEKGKTGEKLTIIHTFGKPNRYLYSKAGETSAKELSGNETMIPFAGSDFWVADLALEFLDWPSQRAVRKEMRQHKSCVMLESTNPNPAPAGYSKVDSWLTIESPHAPVTAEGYDSTGKKMKVFTVDSVERVEGKYQLRSIEMRNLKTKTRSYLEFDL